MSPLFKHSRVRLAPTSSDDLRWRILERDGWRCQLCSTIYGLEVHHIDYRNRQGSDCEENLIAVCGDCHSAVHRRGWC